MHRSRSLPGCPWAPRNGSPGPEAPDRRSAQRYPDTHSGAAAQAIPTPCLGGCATRRDAPSPVRQQSARAISTAPSPASRRASGQGRILTLQGRESTGAAPASASGLSGPASQRRPMETPSRNPRPSFRRRAPARRAGPAAPASSSQEPSGRLELLRPTTRSAPIQHAASSPAETSRITKTSIVPPLSATPSAR